MDQHPHIVPEPDIGGGLGVSPARAGRNINDSALPQHWGVASVIHLVAEPPPACAESPGQVAVFRVYAAALPNLKYRYSLGGLGTIGHDMPDAQEWDIPHPELLPGQIDKRCCSAREFEL